jgi:hypothetical protein
VPNAVDCVACATADTDGGDPLPSDPNDFGTVTLDADGAVLPITVPGDLASFTLTLSGPTPGDARLGLSELAAPDGTVLYTLGGDSNINPMLPPYPGASSIMVPVSDDARGQPVAGVYQARVGLFTTSDEITYTGVDGSIASVAVTVKPMDERGGTLDLRISTTPGTAIAPGDQFVSAALDEVRHYYVDVAGLMLSDPVYDTMPDDTFDSIDDGDTLRAACAAYADVGVSGRTINIIIVSQISFAGGLAGGEPGPPGVSHTSASCAVIAKQSTAQATGALMAHETGHFLGLFHTTQLVYDASAGVYTLGGYDPLSDTPECARGTPLESCPDFNNLMFPFFPVSGLEISPAQIEVMARSPWVHQ